MQRAAYSKLAHSAGVDGRYCTRALRICLAVCLWLKAPRGTGTSTVVCASARFRGQVGVDLSAVRTRQFQINACRYTFCR